MSDEQNVLRQLVEREVFFNVHYIVHTLTELLNSGGTCDEFTLDDSFEWYQGGTLDKEEILFQNHLDTKELPGGGWVWYTKGEEPYVDPVPDMQIFEHEGLWWFSGELDEADPDECPDGHFEGAATEREAFEAAWAYSIATGLPSECSDQEEAQDDAISDNDIEVSEYETEIYEHWAVSDFLARRLEGKGERVFDLCGLQVWGRSCTGQAILLDSVIKQIATEMKILPGMKNDWSER